MEQRTKTLQRVCAAAVLCGGVGAAAAYLHTEMDDPASHTIAQGPAPAIVIHETEDLLSSTEQEQLRREMETLPHPQVIDEVHFVISPLGEKGAGTSPGQNETSRRDGVAVVGVNATNGEPFAIYSDDIARELQLDSGRMDPRIYHAMQPAVARGDLAAALTSGARVIADVERVEDNLLAQAQAARADAIFLSGFVGLAIAPIVVVAYTHVRAQRLKRESS